jgi:tetratricopeptide (TPR) repeat protein
MKKRTDTEKDTPKRGKSLEDLIYDALIEKGWLIPQTEENVLRAERALAQVEYSPLPPELVDSYCIIDTLDEPFEIIAETTNAGIEDEPREMSIDPRRLPSLSLDQLLAEKGESKIPAYVYISDESLDDEPATNEVKLLMLELRELSGQRRYKESLELARQATLLEPHYWRAWISYGSLLALLGNIDEGETIFRCVLKDFSDNPKAVAAALHNCAFAKEDRCELKPSGEDLREVSRLYEEALRLDNSRDNTRASLLINEVSRLHEEASRLDDSRDNTRVSLLLNPLLSRQTGKGQKPLEGSLQCEDFYDALEFEIEEREARGVKMYKVIQVLPMWLRNLLFGNGPNHFGSTGDGVAY